MERIKYHYAFDEIGNLVNITYISREYRKHHKFFCVSCEKEMTARLGNKRTHHFAHKCDNAACSLETYLHKLSKYAIKWKFDNSQTFGITYNRPILCQNRKSCLFYEKYECYDNEYKTIDLKKYFDTCNEEQSIKGFKADLLLSDSTLKYKGYILLEIYVTHKCSERKINSGQKIIEIRISSEEDIENIIKGNISENDNIRFYGFANDEKPLHVSNVPRFVLYKSDAAYIDYNALCNNNTRLSDKSVLELNISRHYSYTEKETIRAYGLAKAITMGYEIKNCAICKYICYDGDTGKYRCNLYKRFSTPHFPKQDHAQNCEYYNIDKRLINTLASNIRNNKIVISVVK